MKHIRIKESSWHYKLATSWDPVLRYNTRNMNICNYSSALFCAIVSYGFVSILVFTALAFIAHAAFHALFGIAFSLYYGTFFFTEIGFLSLIIFSIFGVVGLITLLFKITRSAVKKINENDNFIILACYKSWKNKYCIPIKIEE